MKLFNKTFKASTLPTRHPEYNLPGDAQKAVLIEELIKKGIFSPSDLQDEKDLLDATMYELHGILHQGQPFTKKEHVMHAPTTVANECHAVTAFFWTIHKQPTAYLLTHKEDFRIITGLSDKVHLHSWLYDKHSKTILEPTPIARDGYHGFEVVDPFRFVTEEYNNIQAMIAKNIFCKMDVDAFNWAFSRLLAKA